MAEEDKIMFWVGFFTGFWKVISKNYSPVFYFFLTALVFPNLNAMYSSTFSLVLVQLEV